MITLFLTCRLCLYDMTQSRVTLRAQHGSDEHQILVCTKLVEPFQAQVDSMYLVLGELEHQGESWPHTLFSLWVPSGTVFSQDGAWLLTQQESLTGVNFPSKPAHKFKDPWETDVIQLSGPALRK